MTLLSLHLGRLPMGCMGWVGCMLQMCDQIRPQSCVAEGLMREYSFTCFRYFSNLGLFVFCLMKLSILALASRIVTTLLANLANPSYRVQLLDTETTCINMLTEHMVDIFHIITVVLFLYWYANCQHGTYTLQQLSLNHPERERRFGKIEDFSFPVCTIFWGVSANVTF